MKERKNKGEKKEGEKKEGEKKEGEKKEGEKKEGEKKEGEKKEGEKKEGEKKKERKKKERKKKERKKKEKKEGEKKEGEKKEGEKKEGEKKEGEKRRKEGEKRQKREKREKREKMKNSYMKQESGKLQPSNSIYIFEFLSTAQDNTAHDSTSVQRRNRHLLLLLSSLIPLYPLCVMPENYPSYFRPGNHYGRFTRFRGSFAGSLLLLSRTLGENKTPVGSTDRSLQEANASHHTSFL